MTRAHLLPLALLLAFVSACAEGGPPISRAPRKGPDAGVPGPSAMCGAERSPCCWDREDPCDDGLTCVAGACTARESCGQEGMSCCAGSACEGDLVCTAGRCLNETRCGRRGERCCDSGACAAGLVCTDGRMCEPTTSTDCGGDGEACCEGDHCSAALVCTAGRCGVAPACGGAGEACCASGAACHDGLRCASGRCEAEPDLCGGTGQPCCDGSRCTGTGLSCCEAMCIDVRADDRHCGRCGRACEAGTRCASGSCEADGSGTAPDGARCGLEGLACCAGATPCFGSLSCTAGRCAPPMAGPSCGTEGAACCAVGSPCYTGLVCSAGRCMAGAAPPPGTCGAEGAMCCATGPACMTGLSCSAGRCTRTTMPPPGTCGAEGAMCCATGPACMTGLTCDRGRCARSMMPGDAPGCGTVRTGCTSATSCCHGLACREASAGSRQCCFEAAGTCASDADCCGNMTCNRTTNRCQCRTAGQTCRAAGDCCTGLACEGGVCTTPSDPSAACTSATSCNDCAARAGCGYCATSRSCLRGSATGPATGSCADWDYYASDCTAAGDDCSRFTTCTTCTGSASCVFCNDGRCMNAFAPDVCAPSVRADWPDECSSMGRTVPPGWSCSPGWYDGDDGCDCECGLRDPDCDDPGTQVYGCPEAGSTCSAAGRCVPPGPRIPPEWTCAPSYYGTADGCDCNCGARDPDCDNPSAIVFGCQAGETCDASGRCAGGMSVPPGWTCPAGYYGTRDGCDCGCGAHDPDCDDATATVYGCAAGERCEAGHCTGDGSSCESFRVCEDCVTFGCGYCGAPGLGSCMAGSASGPTSGSCTEWRYGDEGLCRGAVPPPEWSCPAAYYATGDGCDCGYCGAWDPDCDDPTARLYGCEAGQSCNDEGRCVDGGLGCADFRVCSDCVTFGCGWCGEAPLGECRAGSASGPSSGSCSEGWSFGSTAMCSGSSVPAAWTCAASWYATEDGCDCNCGAPDPDCTPGATVYHCAAGEICDDTGRCVTPPPTVPSSWTCAASWYATEDGCDCNCGAPDPDCTPGATVYHCPSSTDRCVMGRCVAAVLCDDTCSWAGDGTCDDGGPGSSFSVCPLGTDCEDCGPR